MDIIRLTILCILFFTTTFAHATFTIASKARTIGPNIHRTYFITPNNGYFDVKGQVYAGYLIAGRCVYATIQDIGTEKIHTGDFIEFDAFKIKSQFGTSYNCLQVYYTVHQFVTETFGLFFDGFNYYGTFPAYDEVMLV